MSRYAFTLRGQTHHVVLEEHADGPRFVVAGTTFEPQVTERGEGLYDVELDGETFSFTLHNGTVEIAGAPLELQIRRARPALVRKAGAGRRGDGRIKPPMPGKIIEVVVRPGDVVVEGQVLAVLEAMKMQNDIKSPLAGTVSKVHVQEGANVEASTILIEVEPEATS